MATLADMPPLAAQSGGPRHLSEAIADAITSAIAQGAKEVSVDPEGNLTVLSPR